MKPHKISYFLMYIYSQNDKITPEAGKKGSFIFKENLQFDRI